MNKLRLWGLHLFLGKIRISIIPGRSWGGWGGRGVVWTSYHSPSTTSVDLSRSAQIPLMWLGSAEPAGLVKVPPRRSSPTVFLGGGYLGLPGQQASLLQVGATAPCSSSFTLWERATCLLCCLWRYSPSWIFARHRQTHEPFFIWADLKGHTFVSICNWR